MTRPRARGESRVRRRRASTTTRSREAEEDDDRAIEPHHIFIRQRADPTANSRFWNRRHLIDHQSRRCLKSILLGRIDPQSKKRSVGGIGRQRADRDGFGGVESIVLQHDGRARFSGVGFAGDGPDVTALQSFHSEIASTKAWLSRSAALRATSSDWRCASRAKARERTSGTHIWIGRRP